MKTIAIFKTGLLPATQTFIPAQVGAMKRFHPQYVGLERVEGGYPLDAEPVLLVTRRSLFSRLYKIAYKLTGFGPKFHRQIAATKPVLLHAHFVLDGIHALPIVASLELPLVVTLHGHIPTVSGKALPPNSIDGFLYARRLRKLWRRTDLFICVSEFIKQRALELGYPEEKLRVHYIGTDCEFFTPGAEPRDPKLVLFVGRFAEKKGASYLLRAMAEVRKQVPDAKVVMVGDGPDKLALEQLSRDLDLDVHFTGKQNTAQVLEWVRQARVFAGPSITAADGDAEALGMVFAEAQATGLPVVSFAHGGIPEVVRHTETGLLAPEGDTTQLAAHIAKLLLDEPFWQATSQNALTWTHQQFNLTKQTQKLEDIYHQILNQ
jgi:colanic acid/amylovoran biosynthesis glycosyltransferase